MSTQIFFNTIQAQGELLHRAIVAAGNQNNRIMAIFNAYAPEGDLTAFEVLTIYKKFHKNSPITSIRRSLTVLTENGLLIKTDKMRLGEYHLKTHCWKLKK